MIFEYSYDWLLLWCEVPFYAVLRIDKEWTLMQILLLELTWAVALDKRKRG